MDAKDEKKNEERESVTCEMVDGKIMYSERKRAKTEMAALGMKIARQKEAGVSSTQAQPESEGFVNCKMIKDNILYFELRRTKAEMAALRMTLARQKEAIRTTSSRRKEAGVSSTQAQPEYEGFVNFKMLDNNILYFERKRTKAEMAAFRMIVPRTEGSSCVVRKTLPRRKEAGVSSTLAQP